MDELHTNVEEKWNDTDRATSQ